MPLLGSLMYSMPHTIMVKKLVRGGNHLNLHSEDAWIEEWLGHWFS
jgi:hypothetical protein